MITLASDFGSPYPAAMRGVLCARTDARLVDVAHDFPRQDVRTAAFWLRELLPTFPAAVHLAVVDPGVGTDRRPLVVEAGEHALVGPDNGLLLPAARALADGADVSCYEIPVEDPESATFHGRDVFAPAAAAVHDDGRAALDYPPVDDPVDLAFPEPTVRGDEARGEVLVVDGFGNAITNVPGDVLTGRWGTYAHVDGERVPVARTYDAVGADERLLTVGSHGNVELAVNRGRGDAAFGVEAGSRVRLALP
ncbi:S-adenosylmethionine hydrolase [Halarchaeum rubridurum]|uniref:S-adenosylmethionine hydrolase n=1 Tax=Halarchaeum rubridurum TaxID=489911 RepID=A0A830FW48_9EURY|nr:SAM-dependent chlorinase/fluorinase [Halarchaeum rubridurum]MBP1955240.1 S-adenosylmethionine hydrolase [Halarchaeum rubridurum]GGM67888.1 S-adenosylmethionine hydroxide adenosyltransferase [Halarchaeum rubridurum]